MWTIRRKHRRSFTGLETPPAVTHGAPGRRFILHATDLGSLDIGSPVYYRRIQVGRIVSYQLDKDGRGVSLQLFVDGPNDRFVTGDTRFWNASGVDVSLGADGLKLNTQSLATVIAGGVAFQEPPGPRDESPAAENAEYTLFNDQGAAMAPPDGKPRYIRMRFEHSLRGLNIDAPVEFLGVKIGKVVSVNLDYDEAKHSFPVIVGAVVYPQRLGMAYDKLSSLAQARGDTDLSQVMAKLVDYGLRAQARTGNLLTGQLYIAFDFVPKAPKVAFDPTAKPLMMPTAAGDFDRLQEQLSSIVDKISRDPLRHHRAEPRRQPEGTERHAETGQHRTGAGGEEDPAGRAEDHRYREQRALAGFAAAAEHRPEHGRTAARRPLAARADRLPRSPSRVADPRPQGRPGTRDREARADDGCGQTHDAHAGTAREQAMIRVTVRLLAATAVLTLAACASAPTHFHTLVPPAAGAANAASAPFLIDVQPVGVPPQVDQPQMVLRQGSGGVALLDNERWIAPLGDEIRGALSADLSRSLNTHDVYGLPRSASQPVVRVKMDVNRFDAELGGEVVVESVWTVRPVGAADGQALSCGSRVHEPAGGDYAGVVAAQQRALARIADDIATAVRAASQGRASCPAQG